MKAPNVIVAWVRRESPQEVLVWLDIKSYVCEPQRVPDARLRMSDLYDSAIEHVTTHREVPQGVEWQAESGSDRVRLWGLGGPVAPSMTFSGPDGVGGRVALDHGHLTGLVFATSKILVDHMEKEA